MQGLFDGVSAREREDAMQHFHRIDVRKPTTLMEEGDPDPALIYILDGRVEIVRAGTIIDQSGGGEVVGEMSLFTGKPRVATVRSVGEGSFLVLDKLGYKRLIEANNEVAYTLERLVLTQLADRLRRLDGLIARNIEGVPSPYKKPAPSMLQRIRALFTTEPPPAPLVAKLREPVEVLEGSPVFAGARHLVLKVIASAMTVEAHPAGTFLCTQGEPGDRMFVLADGFVDVVVATDSASADDERIHRITTLSRGAAFGMTAMIDERPRMASVVARDRVEVLVLDRAAWKRFAEESTVAASAMRVAMIRAFAQQVDEAGATLVKNTVAPMERVRAGARLEHS